MIIFDGGTDGTTTAKYTAWYRRLLELATQILLWPGICKLRSTFSGGSTRGLRGAWANANGQTNELLFGTRIGSSKLSPTEAIEVQQ